MALLNFAPMILDFLLFAGVAFLGYRLIQAPHGAQSKRQIADLQRTMKELIIEAENASHALNAELEKRQRSLERVLNDVETNTARSQKYITQGEDLRGRVERLLARLDDQRSTLIEKTTSPTRSAPAPSPVAEPQPSYIVQDYFNEEIVQENNGVMLSEELPAIEPPSFKGTSGGQISGTKNRRVNIYGEEIVAETPSVERGSPLSQQIEVDSIPHSTKVPSAQSQSQKAIQSAAEKTRLTAQQVSTLSNFIRTAQEQRKEKNTANNRQAEIVPPAATLPRKDARLGVLGQMKRQVQVL